MVVSSSFCKINFVHFTILYIHIVMDNYHRSLYKRKTPPWKESLRERCCQRLKSSRQLMFDRCRSIPCHEEESDQSLTKLVGSVVTQEFNKLKGCQSLPSLWNNSSYLEDLTEEDILATIEEIQQELLSEEQRALNEYYMNIQLEDRMMMMQADRMEDNDVLCPLCQRQPLKQEGPTIVCLCGLRIDTQPDGGALEELRVSLYAGLQMHSEGMQCPQNPTFSTTNTGEGNNLLMTCQSCDFMYVVL